MRMLFELYYAFMRMGFITFGGGLVMLPILKYELVVKRRWISEDELIDFYAVGQCTPGIIAFNVSTYVGYRKKGVPGGIFATLGMLTPSLLIVSAVASFIELFMENVWVQHAMLGIRGIVCALLLNTSYELVRKDLRHLKGIVIAAAAFLLTLFTPLPVVVIVLFAAAAGVVISKLSERKREAAGE